MTENETDRQVVLKAAICEFLGTFFLVLIGTGAIVIDAIPSIEIGHLGISLAFGLVVFVVIYSMGFRSGAHINPAVSIGFFASGDIGFKKLVGYLIAQFAGAFLASTILMILFTSERGLGQTMPNMGLEIEIGVNMVVTCLIVEFLMTFILMWVILAITSKANTNLAWAGLVVGGVIAMEALVAGPISGASMNPARSLAPAVLSGQLEHFWIYILAPISGALAASLFAPPILGARVSENSEPTE